MTPEQLARLPLHARKHVEYLERRIAQMEALVSEATNPPQAGDTFGYTDLRIGDGVLDRPVFALPKFARLMAFPNHRRHTLDLDVRDYCPFRLEVRATWGNGLIVRSQAANVVSIEVDPR